MYSTKHLFVVLINSFLWVCNLLNSPVPYPDLKLTETSFMWKKWIREWDAQSDNKLKEIKWCFTIWSSLIHRKADVIISRLRIGHSGLPHRHLFISLRGAYLLTLSFFSSYHSPSITWLSLLMSYVQTLFLLFTTQFDEPSR